MRICDATAAKAIPIVTPIATGRNVCRRIMDYPRKGLEEINGDFLELLRAQRIGRIHRCRATCRQEARRQRREPQQHGYAAQSQCVPGLHTE